MESKAPENGGNTEFSSYRGRVEFGMMLPRQLCRRKCSRWIGASYCVLSGRVAGKCLQCSGGTVHQDDLAFKKYQPVAHMGDGTRVGATHSSAFFHSDYWSGFVREESCDIVL